MFPLNQLANGVRIPDVEWHGSTIITIADEPYNGELCDLSVEEDATFVASGVLLSNCRSAVLSVTDEQATDLGIGIKPTDGAEPSDGFGASPDQRGYEPDTSGIADELVSASKVR